MKKIILAFFILFVVICMPFFILFTEDTQEELDIGNENLTPEVEQYRELVRKYAELENIPDLEYVLMAIIMQESGGSVPDVMQSSESLGLPPNSITDPEISIAQGTSYFASLYNRSEQNLDVAIQSYNFGGGFIDYIRNRGGQYTLELAHMFSIEQAIRLGWNRYGDPEYVPHVKRYFPIGTGIWTAPVPAYSIITSNYGVRIDPITGKSSFHDGIDFSGIEGETPIFAVDSGKVVYAQFNDGGFGNCIVIDHGYIQSVYGHLYSIGVSVGDTINQGQQIGILGNTGRSTGPHLHLQAQKKLFSDIVDPNQFLR